ncbi:ankyrin repeat domain-containing protein 50-like [Strongylocentrotus purpuratus]|uniref:Protein kinase domain-containing protein n=1 Tax=Strongylocentrotus purpuratus TaxID=7668 RepID=A0A7M7T0H8_STRPU|nr:ankyrin repeat domain-containing protein 50-like [Strongylocentrotus purpuratus]
MAKRAVNEPAEVDKALLMAASNGCFEMVVYLVGQGAQMKKGGKNGFTPLHVASQEGHLDVVEYLVGQGAQIEDRDNDDSTPLHYASCHGHLDVVKYLIGQEAQVDYPNKNGITALFFASNAGHRDLVEYLVGQGAQVEKCDNNKGMTPLHAASQKGHLYVVEYLVGQGAQVEKGDNDGDTPLHFASKEGHLDVVEYLVGEGAQVERGDNNGGTPLLFASWNGHLDVVQYLVGQGAQVERGDNKSNTPLMFASCGGHLDVVQYLVGQGAQVEKGNNDGMTPLYSASGDGHFDVVKYLIGQGAHIDKPTKLGTTALIVASEAGHIDVVQYLMSKQAQRKEASPEESAGVKVRVPQPVLNLETIVMADLTVKDSSGGKYAFHEKKARKLEGCHLGGGSFGEVYKATHTVHDDVAVKLAKSGKEGQVVMYQKEARKHENSLICEHIVPIKGFVECEDDACNCGLIGIVMKYMENGSLWDFRTTKWLQHPDLLPLINRMVYEMSSGMQFLHSKDIIHRDLKLENVLVDGDLHVKIADLGLATNLQTSFGDRCWGTDSHKPPEAFRTDLPNSTKVVTPKYDVYSFAMTLYELLTGIHPYSDRGFDMMKLLKVEEKQPPCLQPVPVNTPKDLIEVMKESWSYEANERPNFIAITIITVSIITIAIMIIAIIIITVSIITIHVAIMIIAITVITIAIMIIAIVIVITVIIFTIAG